jgi:hypothetical protein
MAMAAVLALSTNRTTYHSVTGSDQIALTQ